MSRTVGLLCAASLVSLGCATAAFAALGKT
jgi:hypothetical protein